MKRYRPLLLLSLSIVSCFQVYAAVTIDHDTTFSGSISIGQDILLTDSSTLMMSAGTTLLMEPGMSIRGGTRCHIILQGTSAAPVTIRSATPNTYWGQLIVQGDSSSIEMHYADIMSGQTYALDSSILIIEDSYLHDYLRMPAKNLVYTGNAYDLHISRCHISNYYQINFFNTPVLIENCLLEYIHEDGIDCDNSPSATIRNCTFRNGLCEKGKIHSVDAVDFGKYNLEGLGSIGEVQNCFMYNITDKGVSIGEGCRQISVTGCLFYHCGSGATVKDSSVAIINNNTIVSCDYGIECVEKNDGLGGGHATGQNNILWNNQTTTYLDHDGTLSLSYSNISFNGIFPGAGNINAYPMFTDTLALDFHLLAGSPCIGTGSNGSDMGAIFPVGGIIEPGNFLNIGIPHSGEIINGDSLYAISWLNGDSIHSVNLEFSSDEGQSWMFIAQNVNAQTGTFVWTVPNIYSSDCFIRITDAANPANTSMQNLPFSIIPQGLPSTAPSFSYAAGYYSNALPLQLSSDGGTKIFYTLDGSDPTDHSPEYTSPIVLSQDDVDSGYTEQNITLTHPPQFPLSSIRTAPVSQIGPNPSYWSLPSGKINRIQVVKARSYTPGKGLSDVITNSYLIDEDGTLNPAELPVISLTTDKENFFDYYSGIYIPGYAFNGYSFTGNYELSGTESERPVHLEYFEKQKPRILSLDIGARIRGEWIRSLGQKALAIYARSEYDDENYFNYEFFPGYKKTDTHALMNKFKRLILRNDGNNWGWGETTMMKDATAQSLFDHMNLKYQAARMSIVFLDGEYWGIHDIRELPDERNLALTYDMDPDKITMLEHNLDGDNQLVTGLESDLASWLDLKDFIAQNDMNQPVNYDYVKARIDVDNLIDYWITTFYAVRLNMNHNTGFWKQSGSALNPDAPPGLDGRWRWQAYDFDYSFTQPSFNTMPFVQSTDVDNKYLIFSLFNNSTFRNRFISRYADLLNSSFKTTRVIERINENRNVIEPEIERHIRRWNTPYSKTSWEAGIDSMKSFAQTRPGYCFSEMQNYFALSSTSLITVNVNDTAEGKIIINTMKVDADLPGVNTPAYPWTGSYFKNFPVTVIAAAGPGYRFNHWLETGSTLDTLTVLLAGDSLLTAIFEIDPDWHPVTYPKIYINEVSASNHTIVDNYGDNPDWIELYNPTDSVVDLSGWYISDAAADLTKHRFLSSDSTKIPANGFLLLYADNEPEQGSTHVSFKLDAGGDNILLSAPDGFTVIDSVSFGMQVSDTSYGRYPDGSPVWEFFSNTTPGASNVHIDVPEHALMSELLIFPNPLSTGILHFSSTATFYLYDELGQELMFREDVKEADLSAFRKGIYFIRTPDGKTARVIKTN
jgi:hypothetical protein